MRKTAALLLALFTLPVPSHAMGDKKKADADCLSSETLRVEIGGKKYAFPRKMIVSVAGPDVVHVESAIDKSAGPRKACQKLEDKVWIVNQLSLKLYPRTCPRKLSRCADYLIDVSIRDLKDHRENGGISNIPDTKEKLLQACKAPREPYNDWHAKYWSACRYGFEDENFFYWIQFTGGGDMYPPEDIEQTKATVLKMIQVYRING